MPTLGIIDRLSAGDFLVLDGATGTEIQKRGVPCPTPGSTAIANIEAPDVLESIHADYLQVGADIITSNNFLTGPTAPGMRGHGELWKECAIAGIEIAKKARAKINREAYVAGGVYPYNLDGDEFSERVQLLAENGVDLILAEAVGTIEASVMVAQACADVDLPLFIGLGNLTEYGTLADGTAIDSVASSLQNYRVDGLFAMDSFPPSISAALPRIKQSFSGFVGVYPHCGLADTSPEVVTASEIEFSRYYSPDEFARYATDWKSLGAQIIGGCCGTSPSYIEALTA